jgi:hypothetical protein
VLPFVETFHCLAFPAALIEEVLPLLLLPVLRQDEREDPRRKHGGRRAHPGQWQVLKGCGVTPLNLSVLQQQYPHLFEVPPCASLFNSLGS